MYRIKWIVTMGVRTEEEDGEEEGSQSRKKRPMFNIIQRGWDFLFYDREQEQ